MTQSSSVERIVVGIGSGQRCLEDAYNTMHFAIPVVLCNLQVDQSVIRSPSHAGQQNMISSPNCFLPINPKSSDTLSIGPNPEVDLVGAIRAFRPASDT